jgi:D-3-phosphoglycerate dehydrogenase
MNIVILDDYQDAVRKLDCASKLDNYSAKVYTNTVKGIGQLAVRLRDAEIIILIRGRTCINAALLDKLPKLRLIVQTGGIGSHLDLAACTERGIAVAAGGGNPRATAELTFALIMAALRRLPSYISNLKHGIWQQAGLKSASMPVNFGLGELLHGKTLGIWGYGEVGKLVAGYGRAFGMQVKIWGREQSLKNAQADGYDTFNSTTDLFKVSDVLSLHLRLTAETIGLIKLSDLSSMKPTALLVNTSHAELIEPDALLVGLNRGRPGMAAIDVFESEPILQGQALLRLENCICSPHIGYVERNQYEDMFSTAFDHAVSFIEGRTSAIINPDYQLKLGQSSLGF